MHPSAFDSVPLLRVDRAHPVRGDSALTSTRWRAMDDARARRRIRAAVPEVLSTHPRLASLAQERWTGCHVDACIGASCWSSNGTDARPPCDFRVPASRLSADGTSTAMSEGSAGDHAPLKNSPSSTFSFDGWLGGSTGSSGISELSGRPHRVALPVAIPGRGGYRLVGGFGRRTRAFRGGRTRTPAWRSSRTEVTLAAITASDSAPEVEYRMGDAVSPAGIRSSRTDDSLHATGMPVHLRDRRVPRCLGDAVRRTDRSPTIARRTTPCESSGLIRGLSSHRRVAGRQCDVVGVWCSRRFDRRALAVQYDPLYPRNTLRPLIPCGCMGRSGGDSRGKCDRDTASGGAPVSPARPPPRHWHLRFRTATRHQPPQPVRPRNGEHPLAKMRLGRPSSGGIAAVVQHRVPRRRRRTGRHGSAVSSRIGRSTARDSLVDATGTRCWQPAPARAHGSDTHQVERSAPG